MKTIADELAEHPFFENLERPFIELIAQCGVNTVFDQDSIIAKEGDEADEFYVLRKGRVAIQLHTPERGNLLLQTLDGGDILGWSWLFPPYRWTFEVKASQTVHAIRMDGQCLRGKCDDDPRLGYELMKRFAQIMSNRLEATRLQMMDLYGKVDL